jgi:hypothetical protein
LRIKKKRNATETIDTGIKTQDMDRITVNREIATSTAMKVITSNKIMKTLTVIKVKVTVIMQEADSAMTASMGKEIKTEANRNSNVHRQDGRRQENQNHPRQQELPTQIQHTLPRVTQIK